jgi:hypothetical protein
MSGYFCQEADNTYFRHCDSNICLLWVCCCLLVCLFDLLFKYVNALSSLSDPTKNVCRLSWIYKPSFAPFLYVKPRGFEHLCRDSWVIWSSSFFTKNKIYPFFCWVICLTDFWKVFINSEYKSYLNYTYCQYFSFTLAFQFQHNLDAKSLGISR